MIRTSATLTLAMIHVLSSRTGRVSLSWLQLGVNIISFQRSFATFELQGLNPFLNQRGCSTSLERVARNTTS